MKCDENYNAVKIFTRSKYIYKLSPSFFQRFLYIRQHLQYFYLRSLLLKSEKETRKLTEVDTPNNHILNFMRRVLSFDDKKAWH